MEGVNRLQQSGGVFGGASELGRADRTDLLRDIKASIQSFRESFELKIGDTTVSAGGGKAVALAPPLPESDYRVGPGELKSAETRQAKLTTGLQEGNELRAMLERRGIQVQTGEYTGADYSITERGTPAERAATMRRQIEVGRLELKREFSEEEDLSGKDQIRVPEVDINTDYKIVSPRLETTYTHTELQGVKTQYAVETAEMHALPGELYLEEGLTDQSKEAPVVLELPELVPFREPRIGTRTDPLLYARLPEAQIEEVEFAMEVSKAILYRTQQATSKIRDNFQASIRGVVTALQVRGSQSTGQGVDPREFQDNLLSLGKLLRKKDALGEGAESLNREVENLEIETKKSKRLIKSELGKMREELKVALERLDEEYKEIRSQFQTEVQEKRSELKPAELEGHKRAEEKRELESIALKSVAEQLKQSAESDSELQGLRERESELLQTIESFEETYKAPLEKQIQHLEGEINHRKEIAEQKIHQKVLQLEEIKQALQETKESVVEIKQELRSISIQINDSIAKYTEKMGQIDSVSSMGERETLKQELVQLKSEIAQKKLGYQKLKLEAEPKLGALAAEIESLEQQNEEGQAELQQVEKSFRQEKEGLETQIREKKEVYESSYKPWIDGQISELEKVQESIVSRQIVLQSWVDEQVALNQAEAQERVSQFQIEEEKAGSEKRMTQLETKIQERKEELEAYIQQRTEDLTKFYETRCIELETWGFEVMGGLRERRSVINEEVLRFQTGIDRLEQGIVNAEQGHLMSFCRGAVSRETELECTVRPRHLESGVSILRSLATEGALDPGGRDVSHKEVLSEATVRYELGLKGPVREFELDKAVIKALSEGQFVNPLNPTVRTLQENGLDPILLQGLPPKATEQLNGKITDTKLAMIAVGLYVARSTEGREFLPGLIRDITQISKNATERKL